MMFDASFEKKRSIFIPGLIEFETTGTNDEFCGD